MENKNNSYASQLLHLWSHINYPRRIHLILLMILMIITSFAEVFSIGAVIPFLTIITNPENFFDNKFSIPLINFFNISNAEQLLMPLTILFILSIIIAGTLRILLLWAQTRLSHVIGADCSFKIYNNTLLQKYSVHISRNSSEIISAIVEKSNMVVRQVILPMLSIISSIWIFLFIFFTLVYLSPVITLLTFISFGAIYLSIIFLIRKKVKNNSIIINNFATERFKSLQEGLGGIRHVIIDGVQNYFYKIYCKSDMPLRMAQASNAFIGASPRFGIEALGMVFIAIIALILSKNEGDISNSLPILGAFALGAQRILPLLQSMYSNWSALKGAEATFYETLNLLNQRVAKHYEVTKKNNIKFDNQILIKDITFRYSSNTPIILSDINLKIKKGSRLGVIGTTGGGKSTLIDLVAGLLEPNKGDLIVDKVKINYKNRSSWMSNVAYVPQSVFLSDATIAENIAFGIPKDKINMSLVKKCAELAQIAQTINKWKSKYNKNIGERGIKLSGGQIQRIGIARALYKRANVIIFDEATSSLDSQTENKIMNTIYKIDKNITIIIVAHRLSSLNNCDQIIEISNGKIKKLKILR